MNKKRNLRFLSQSVLLEEEGLPRGNILIIVVIFMMLIAFITWSFVMKIDEELLVEGIVIEKENGVNKHNFEVMIPPNNMSVVKEGLLVSVVVIGVNDKNPITGTLGSLDHNPRNNGKGDLYFGAVVNLNSNQKSIESINQSLMPGMKIDAKIIVGNKTLMEYFLGPIMQVKENAFKEK